MSEPVTSAEAVRRVREDFATIDAYAGQLAVHKRGGGDKPVVTFLYVEGEDGRGAKAILHDDQARVLASALIGQDVDALMAVCEAAREWSTAYTQAFADVERSEDEMNAAYQRWFAASDAIHASVNRLDAGQEAGGGGC
jgi:hypothetical protein